MKTMIDFQKILKVRSRIVDWVDISGCFVNVHRMAKANGGRAVYGWLGGAVIFPEKPLIRTWVHHAVWEMPNGDLRCITPQADPSLQGAFITPTIDFIPDETATLLELPGGLFRGRMIQYQALENTGAVRAAITDLKKADEANVAGDYEGEAYWVAEACKRLPGWITPHGPGAKQLVPFKMK